MSSLVAHSGSVSTCSCSSCEKLRIRSKLLEQKARRDLEARRTVEAHMRASNDYEAQMMRLQQERYKRALASVQYSGQGLKAKDKLSSPEYFMPMKPFESSQPRPLVVVCDECKQSYDPKLPHESCERPAFLCDVCGHADFKDLAMAHTVSQDCILNVCQTCKVHLTSSQMTIFDEPKKKTFEMVVGLKPTDILWGAGVVVLGVKGVALILGSLFS